MLWVPAPARRLHTVGGSAAARQSVITGVVVVTKMVVAAAAHSSIINPLCCHAGYRQPWLYTGNKETRWWTSGLLSRWG